jgi:hypothetical protein
VVGGSGSALGNLRLRSFSGGALLGRGENVDKNEKMTKDDYPSLISVTEMKIHARKHCHPDASLR